MTLINWSLARNPLNWITVGLMLTFAAIAGTLALHGVGLTPSTNSGSTKDDTSADLPSNKG